MAKFTDRLNREWKIEIHGGLLRPLREVGFDLNKIFKDASAWDVMDDLDTRMQVFWVLVEEQAKAESITPEDFARGFDGPAFAKAFDALSEALLAFRQRPAVAAVQIERLPALMKRMEQIEIAKIHSGSSGTSGNVPASPEPTPLG